MSSDGAFAASSRGSAPVTSRFALRADVMWTDHITWKVLPTAVVDGAPLASLSLLESD